MATPKRRLFLRHFEPSSIDHRLLVNRQDDVEWLVDGLSSYLNDPEPHVDAGVAFCVTGEKGVGKTILTCAALRRLREKFSGDTLFLSVDCRRLRSAREVFDNVAQEVVKGLSELKDAMAKIPDELTASARILATITRFDDAELKVIHEHIEQFKVAVGLKGDRSLLKSLNLNFGISLERSSKTVKDLAGKVRFDADRLCRSLCALFKDVRACELDVVLYLDNIDELRHSYRSAEDRERVWLDTETLLSLRDAPIGLVLNMRTYYSGILPREVSNRRVLRSLSADELRQIAELRLGQERDEIKAAMRDGGCKEMLKELAEVAPTPLAYLTWVKFLFEEGMLSSEGIEPGLVRYLEAFYSNLSAETLRCVAKAFKDLERPITRAALLDACEGNEAVLAQLQDRQAVLPVDFWNPVEFTLDPELLFLHPKRTPVGSARAAKQAE
jgi:hypothetical protein